MESSLETYSSLRQFADSWWLLMMFGFLVGVVVWTFRPGSKRTHDDIADIPMRDDDLTRLRDRADAEAEATREGQTGGPAEGRPADKANRAERLTPREI